MTDPQLEAARRRIAGPEPLLIIEAPAGHGKTYEAVQAAETIAVDLTPGREVLFLTHTNGARDTFNRRLRGGAAAMKTIHGQAAEIVEVYSAPLGLPRPLEPYRGKPHFDEMIKLAAEILRRRPEVARGLALRHPVILVDEYQDCSQPQNELVELIAAAAATRVRLFGDHMQGIYDWVGDEVDFGAMTEAGPTVRLETPQRWAEQPELEQFLVGAREALEAGRPIDLTDPPACVHVHVWRGAAPTKEQRGYLPEVLATLRGIGRDFVALTHHNVHALGLHKQLPGQGRFHEGTDHDPARVLLEKVVDAEGNPRVLAGLLVDAMDKWGKGMTKHCREQIAEVCTDGGIVIGTKRKIADFARICEELYATPTTRQWLSCLRCILDGGHGIDGWRVLRADQIYLLARVRPGPEDECVALLHAESRARDAIRPAPRSGFMSIHKAKGLEFGTVALPYCAGALFSDDEASRRRMYVAASRAQTALHFLVSEEDPTPLLAT